jgi:hypothetical protein
MMTTRKRTQWTGWLVLPTIVLLAGSTIRADEDGRAAPRPSGWASAAMHLLTAGDDGYWIGIMGAPIDPLLKTHLRIESGVVVQHVVPDSPADKAKIKASDILLKFGDADISDVLGLAKAVGENEGKEVKITLLREGKERTVSVTPAKQPERWPVPSTPHPVDWRKFQDWMKKLEKGQLPEYPLDMWFVQPGVVLPKEWKDLQRGMPFSIKRALRLPKNTSVTVTKTEEGPAKIVVKKDGETWEVNEDELDKLPEGVREIVKGVLGGGFSFSIPGQGGGEFRFEWPDRPSKHGLRPAPKPDAEEEAGAESGEAPAEEQSDALRKKFDDMNRRMREREKEIEHEMEKMRKEIDRLKKTKV